MLPHLHFFSSKQLQQSGMQDYEGLPSRNGQGVSIGYWALHRKVECYGLLSFRASLHTLSDEPLQLMTSHFLTVFGENEDVAKVLSWTIIGEMKCSPHELNVFGKEFHLASCAQKWSPV